MSLPLVLQRLQYLLLALLRVVWAVGSALDILLAGNQDPRFTVIVSAVLYVSTASIFLPSLLPPEPPLFLLSLSSLVPLLLFRPCWFFWIAPSVFSLLLLLPLRV